MSNRKKSELCHYLIVGCPKKGCKAAHSREELYIPSCPLKKQCIDRDCKLMHPNQSINKLYARLLKEVIQPPSSGNCPYGKDCPEIYCCYCHEKFPLDWNDESPPDFRQPLVFR